MFGGFSDLLGTVAEWDNSADRVTMILQAVTSLFS